MSIGGFSIDSRDLPLQAAGEGRRQALPAAVGRGETQFLALDAGLTYLDTDYLPERALRIFNRNESAAPQLVLTLGLAGQSCFLGSRGEAYYFAGGYATLSCFGACEGERRYAAAQAVRQLRWCVDQPWLARYCGAEQAALVFDRQGRQALSHRPVPAANLALAGQLAACAGAWRPLLAQGLGMSLLALELDSVLAAQPADAAGLSRQDKALAAKARELLLAEFKQPPSVLELAARVGTNAFKLKRLFHQCFQSTPYQLLTEYRMNLAYRLLANEGLQVSQAAERVGYRQAGNFSAAFSRHFGVPPKAVAKRG